MAGVNKVVLIGHVGADPEIKNKGAGKAMATFSLATSKSWKDKSSGERKERTAWHRIVVWAEELVRTVEHHVKKGAKLYVEGKILYRTWEEGGQKKYITEIVLDGFGSRIEFLDRSSGGGVPEADSEDDYGTRTSDRQSDRPAAAPSIDDDIPF